MSIVDKFNRRADAINSLLCVGLDTDIQRLPDVYLEMQYPQYAFNRYIIDQTHPFTSAYKLNIAFYEARGEIGWREMRLTMDYIQERHPDIFTICDAKRADIGSTNEAYARAFFDEMGFDAVTLHPYLGREALEPFLKRADKGCIVLCRTSNPGADELQDLEIDDKPLWQIVAERVRDHWNAQDNCMLVVGATYPNEMRMIREIVGDMTLLVPGIGIQGGNVAQTVMAGLNSEGKGMMINSSRGIIFAENPARAARNLQEAINEHRVHANG